MSGVKFRKGKMTWRSLITATNVLFIFDSNLDSKTLKISPKPAPEAEITEEDADEKEVEEEVILFNLSDEDIEFIYDNTHYSLNDIKDWHRFDHNDLFL